MKVQDTFHDDIRIIIELVYTKLGFAISNPASDESVEYGACSFSLDGRMIQQRVSKITPTKNGQFVTVWKRNKNGITQPFDISDNIDFVVITSRSGEYFGQFVFPKSILVAKGIMSRPGKDGKRGIRVYPPWDIPESKQAAKTQLWQTKYFFTINGDGCVDASLVSQLLSLDQVIIR